MHDGRRSPSNAIQAFSPPRPPVSSGFKTLARGPGRGSETASLPGCGSETQPEIPIFDATIEPHPDLAGDAPKYHPFAWREFIQGRIDDNFSDIGEEDIQVSRFKIEETC